VKRHRGWLLGLSLAWLGAAQLALAQPAASTAQTPRAVAATGAPKFQAGKHYQRLSPAQPTSSPPGKIEVAEVFMFGCPGCNALEPRLQSWLETLPDYVSFVRIPAPWNATADLHARAYYTAEALGVTGQIEAPMFSEFHVKKNFLETEDKLAAFFAQFGVTDKTFRDTFESSAVDEKVGRAAESIMQFRVDRTPSIVVNGKYLTNGLMAATYADWFAILDELIATEHAGGASPPR
jgi:thiol:disulfide interchange protein DsbA